MTETLEQFLLYDNWANDILFKTFAAYSDQMPPSCLRLLSHLINAQSTWLNRINGEKQVAGIWDVHDLEGCKKLYSVTSQGLKTALEKNSKDLNAKIEYANSQGRVFQNTLFDMFFQAFNHATYHRGQIAMEMRQNNLQPANTDYINFVR